jgi:hypothetical protein
MSVACLTAIRHLCFICLSVCLPVRHLASSGVDVYTAVAGGVGALYGPLHGGANEAVLRMLERIKSTDNIPAFLDRVKARKEKLSGFGHRCATIESLPTLDYFQTLIQGSSYIHILASHLCDLIAISGSSISTAITCGHSYNKIVWS